VTKYLKVVISGRFGDETFYEPLDDREHTPEELYRIGQDRVNEEYSWGIGEELLDESEVPEGDRVE